MSDTWEAIGRDFLKWHECYDTGYTAINSLAARAKALRESEKLKTKQVWLWAWRVDAGWDVGGCFWDVGSCLRTEAEAERVYENRQLIKIAGPFEVPE